MSTPGFTAETSLYRTSASSRGLTTGSDRLAGVVVRGGSWTPTFDQKVWVDDPFPYEVCGALGAACCRSPYQNVPEFGPLVSCDQGLGCDIMTNKCVSTCGGPGQVCCDGPETRAPKWTADGKVYSPNYWNMREMCDNGACDRQTHRCFTCGTQDGGPCCPPDAAQATARCVGAYLECQFDSEVFAVSGTCRACGYIGKPPCHWGCYTGRGIRNGLCDICGDEGQLACDDGCHPGLRPQGGVCRVPPPPPPPPPGGFGGATICGASGQTPCARGCNQGLVVRNGLCATPQSPPPESCSNIGGPCVPDNQPGTHCCQHGGTPELCVYGSCKACIPHGEECARGGTQICCSAKDGDVCVLDQFSEKIVCGIPG